MNHASTIKKLGREKSGRTALLCSLAESLIIHGSIQTTEAKAKALRPFIEKLITIARENTLSSRRIVLSRLGNRAVASEKLSNDIAKRFKDRNGGYVRIVKMSRRTSDAAPMAIIQFVD